MIFGWKKSAVKPPRSRKNWVEPLLNQLRFYPENQNNLIRFDRVSLPPTIHELSLQILPDTWVLLYGDDDFAKALFCDLCFSYILPEKGSVSPYLRGSDVSFLGRSNTTYGKTLVEHLCYGVGEKTRALMEFAVKHALSDRFHRHLNAGTLEFKSHREADELELDERDLMEIAEANLLLQRRKAAVIDTTSDFYQIALEQGFRHSEVFLKSGKILIWIIHDKLPLPANAQYWKMPAYQSTKKLSLSFPAGAHAGYIN